MLGALICRLSHLWDIIKNDFGQHGMFLKVNGAVSQRQGGVIRTNCIDCLDRTNVVQGVVGHRAMEAALTAMGLLAPGSSVAHALPLLEARFKHMWADHGDAISLQYAGTGGECCWLHCLLFQVLR